MNILLNALLLCAVTFISSVSWAQGNPDNGLMTKSAEGYAYYNQKHQWSIDVPHTFRLVEETPDGAVFGDGKAMISVFAAKQERKPISTYEFLHICKLARLKQGRDKIVMQGVKERSCVLLTNNKERGYVFFQNAFVGKRFAAVAFLQYPTSDGSDFYTSLHRNINHFRPGMID